MSALTLAIFFGIFVVIGIILNNSVVGKKNQVDNAFAAH